MLLLALAGEPTLAEAQAAAARVAGGELAEDASRLSRARRAHWAPTLRGQVSGRVDRKDLVGELRLAPLREDSTATGEQWAVVLTWDFSQVVFAREETQLVLAHERLARARREVQAKVAALYVERFRILRRPGTALELLQITADLDALTGGLFHDALERAQSAAEVKP